MSWIRALGAVASLTSEEAAAAEEVVKDSDSEKWQGASSAIQSAEYIYRTGAVWLTFRRGGASVYVVQSVSPQGWNEFVNAPSKGRWVNENWLR